MDGTCNMLWRDDRYKRVSVRKPEEKSQPGKPQCRWNNIKPHYQEIGCEDVHWIHLGGEVWWQALMNTVMNLWFHKRKGF
jgi:hypothetical protein